MEMLTVRSAQKIGKDDISEQVYISVYAWLYNLLLATLENGSEHKRVWYVAVSWIDRTWRYLD